MKHWLWLSLVVVAMDQASKWAVMATLKPFETLTIVPNVNLTLMYNTGAAFSMLARAGGWQRWLLVGFAVAVSAALAIWLIRLTPGERMQAAGLALILGGALGNLIDRVLLGHVIDFIQVYLPFVPLPIFNPWPAFNIADSAITLGVVALLWATLFAPSGESHRAD